MDETTVDYSAFIDTEIRNTLGIKYKMRAIIEMINTKRGIHAAAERVNLVLGSNNVSIKTHSVKTLDGDRRVMYSAKAISVDDADIRNIIQIAPRLKPGANTENGLIKNKLRLTIRGTEKGIPYNHDIEAYVLSYKYVTNTFVADIDIIPQITNVLDKSYVCANTEAITELFSAYSVLLATIITDVKSEISIPNLSEIKRELVAYTKSVNKQNKIPVATKKALDKKYSDRPVLISIFNAFAEGKITI